MGSIIENNIVEETNHLREFGGWETAVMKFHHGIDMVIRNNLIRGVYKAGEGTAVGIWIDVGTQGMRISSNVIITQMDHAAYFEANHGPILFDNNVFIGGGIHQRSQGGVLVHNLFLNGEVMFTYENFENDQGERVGARVIPLFKPNSTTETGRLAIALRNDRWYNNLFIGRGLHQTPQAEGFLLNHNVFLSGAKPTPWADQDSLTREDPLPYEVISDETGVVLKLNLPQAVLDHPHPAITYDLIGESPHVQQGIINQQGQPIDVDHDFYALPRDLARPGIGPFGRLRAGENMLRLWPQRMDTIAR